MPAPDVLQAGPESPVSTAERLADELETQLHISPVACAEEARRAAADAATNGDALAELVASYYLAAAARLSGTDDEALQLCDRADELADALDEPVWRARSLQTRALVHQGAGDDETTIDLLESAVEICRGAGDTAALAQAMTLLGRAFAAIPGFSARAASTLGTARRLWISCRDRDGAVSAQVSLAITYLATSGELAVQNSPGAAAAARQALAAARLAVQEADAAGLAELSVDARLALVDALLACDGPQADLDQALESAASFLSRFPVPGRCLVLHRQRATRLVKSGAAADAVTEARAGLAKCASIDRPREREALLRLLAESLTSTGDLASAVQALTDLTESLQRRSRQSAERRGTVISARLDTERARRSADRERRRAAALEQRNAELAWEAEHDPLTGLANRRALDLALETLAPAPDRPVSICLVDVDRFKRINDTLSHQAGDRVLIQIAQSLRGAVRHGDLPARYGGEEFALVLPGADTEAALMVADRVRRGVEQLMWPFAVPEGRVTVSIGVVTSTGPVQPAELVARADAALYAAKDAGRNRVMQG
ncbi:GGDEF domain-containing protein [Actinotalea sp. M2MS4P-6]|uniref:GGDEF domain-containing protein n=1 Tax=Actinotalea sp. M2MS4P-6 TaxID=2983762 RepID=UPI0021E3802A|nr:GGDEF domain-containing protein [Actinotalea sp. M2MS4P-6]MCV2394105.1 GGDEF domain-containing protein [Actinotalea sp. M2MS4P-6]